MTFRGGAGSETTEIQGQTVLMRFLILHEGWAVDNVGWVTTDGRIWTTIEGKMNEIRPQDMEYLFKQSMEFNEGLVDAIRLSREMKERINDDDEDNALFE